MEKPLKSPCERSPETIEIASTVGVGDSQPVDTQVRSANGSEPPSQTSLRLRPRGRYELLGELARGGLGRVWRARDRELDRVVALKEILVPSHEAGARFLREVQLTARLEHPSIVPVHDAGIWDSGEPFYAMKLVSGRTLEELVQDQEPGGAAAHLALLPSLIAVADAVAYAHAQGVIHRDIKPSNVMVGAFGETVLVDWGIAKDLRAQAPHGPPEASESAPYRAAAAQGTALGAVLGTPAFMAPEQARGEEATCATDIYAVGALLYYVLARRPPHAGRTLEAVLTSARESLAPQIVEHNIAAPRDLIAIAGKAMSPVPSARYPSAELLAHDLKRYQMGQAVTARAYSLRELAGRWVSRNRGLSAAIVSFLLSASQVL
jgi:eukaryotic-like serine/threonine-protein kinase